MIGCLTAEGLNAHVARSSEFTVIENRNEDEIIGREKTRLGIELYKWNGPIQMEWKDTHTLCIRSVMNCSCSCTESVVESTSAL